MSVSGSNASGSEGPSSSRLLEESSDSTSR